MPASRRSGVRACLLLAAVVLAAGCEAVAPVVEAPTLVIEAQDIAFSPERVEIPAGVVLRVVFRNLDEGIPHAVRVEPMRSGVVAPVLFETSIVNGVVEQEFDLEPLQPGPYLFSCPVHPNMQIEAEAR